MSACPRNNRLQLFLELNPHHYAKPEHNLGVKPASLHLLCACLLASVGAEHTIDVREYCCIVAVLILVMVIVPFCATAARHKVKQIQRSWQIKACMIKRALHLDEREPHAEASEGQTEGASPDHRANQATNTFQQHLQRMHSCAGPCPRRSECVVKLVDLSIKNRVLVQDAVVSVEARVVQEQEQVKHKWRLP